MTQRPITEVEICCGDIESLHRAVRGGARRVELCTALSEGGITPCYSMVKAAVALGIPSVNVLIRPRTGDFVYSETEVDAMADDIRFVRSLGATGIVAGALLPDGAIDTRTVRRFMEAAGQGAEFVFHRAFDMTAHPIEALHTLIDLGCDRLLTSGCRENAVAGADMLRRLVGEADGRIAIMAGAGVTPHNVAALIRATGVQAVHSTAKEVLPSRMTFRNEGVNMGAAGADEYARPVTSPTQVADLIYRVNHL